MYTYSSLVLLVSMAAVVSCHIETRQKKNVATSSKDGLTTSMMEQQHSSIVAKQTYRSIMTTGFGGKRPATHIVYCPDGYHTCPSGNTCCLSPSGLYYCCPVSDGTCCADGRHCCNLGYSCNSDNTCRKTSNVCPGQKGTCPLSSTCCRLYSGGYACCPLVKAVCCSNDKCCPSGYYCSSDGKCSPLSGKQHTMESASPINDTLFQKYPTNKKYSVAAALMKQPAIIKAPQNIICPDGGQCPSGNTCCENSSGDYGCCPEFNAVCCSDGVHCCPEGNTCDLSDGKCIPQDAAASRDTAKTAPSPQHPAIKLSGKVNVKQDDFL